MIRQPMLLLLLGAGMVNFLLAEPLDGTMLMAFVVVVIAISIYQEHKTERALAALRDLSSPRALVVRDGVQRRVAGRDVVRGDLLLLAEGDRVPADAVLVDCANFSVDESALTGESVPVRKVAIEPSALSATMGRAGGDATPWVFSGTLVVKGHGMAVAKETGAGTELGKIGAALRTIEPAAHPAAARNRPLGAGSGCLRGGRRGCRGHRLRVDPRQLAGRAAGRHRDRDGAAARRVSRRADRVHGVGSVADVAQACAHAPASRGRNAGISDRSVRGQDRHLDAEPDDGAATHRRRTDVHL